MNTSFHRTLQNLLSRLAGLAALSGATLLATQPAQAQQLDEGIVLGATFGDRACILSLTDSEEVVETFATFEACEDVLVGQRYAFTYDTINIQAASCQGNPECGETEQVVAVTDAAPFNPPRRATIAGLISGDRACYVDLIDTADQRHNLFATFEICEQNIVGKTVDLTYGVENVVAFICNGNIECGLSEQALLITQANVVAAALGIDDLPDGNYRYWSQSTTSTVVTTDELLQHPESTLFLFSKRGNNIVGTWSYIDGEAICVEGQLNSNTVTGIAVQTLLGSSVRSGNNTFAPFGLAHRLFVRQGRQINRSTVRNCTVLLNLNGLHRINAGTVLPPAGC